MYAVFCFVLFANIHRVITEAFQCDEVALTECHSQLFSNTFSTC